MPAPPTDLGAGVAHESDGDIAPRPELVDAVEVARAAAEDESAFGNDPIGSPALAVDVDGAEAVGAHVGCEAESDETAVTHYFEANYPGYVGWRWAVTVASAGAGEPVTVSEVVLLPGPDALTAPEWLPWSDRVRPGDLGAGDLLPSSADDPRLASSSALGDESDLSSELGLGGRNRVLSGQGRSQAAQRWHEGEFGPNGEIARSAPAACSTCGFLLKLSGSMGAGFGVCGNEISPADGHVVDLGFGCGAHSEAEVDTSSTVPVAEVVYDDTTLDYESRFAE